MKIFTTQQLFQNWKTRRDIRAAAEDIRRWTDEPNPKPYRIERLTAALLQTEKDKPK